MEASLDRAHESQEDLGFIEQEKNYPSELAVSGKSLDGIPWLSPRQKKYGSLRWTAQNRGWAECDTGHLGVCNRHRASSLHDHLKWWGPTAGGLLPCLRNSSSFSAMVLNIILNWLRETAFGSNVAVFLKKCTNARIQKRSKECLVSRLKFSLKIWVRLWDLSATYAAYSPANHSGKGSPKLIWDYWYQPATERSYASLDLRLFSYSHKLWWGRGLLLLMSAAQRKACSVFPCPCLRLILYTVRQLIAVFRVDITPSRSELTFPNFRNHVASCFISPSSWRGARSPSVTSISK